MNYFDESYSLFFENLQNSVLFYVRKECMIRFIFGVLIGIVCFYLFANELNWKDLWLQIQTLRLFWLALAICSLLLEFGIRTLRWKVILSAIQPTKFQDLFIGQVIGATLNTLLPLRMGELAKPSIVSKRSSIPFMSVAATAVMERVYDLLGMVSVLVFMVLFLQPILNPQPDQVELIENLKFYGGIFGLIAMSAMAIFFYLASQKETARHIFFKITSIAPKPIQNIFMTLFDGFVSGLGNSTDTKGIWLAGSLSIAMWLNGAFAIYCLFKAFALTLPFGAACFIGVAIALAVALPQAPGFIGVFHVVIENTMLLWGQNPEIAKGFALVFWAVSFIPITLVGLFFVLREDIQLATLWKKQSEKP